MDLGKVRHPVTLKAPLTYSQDSFGHETTATTTDYQRMAAIEPLSGRQLEIAKQVNTEVTHRITVRYLPGLGPEWEIFKGDRNFKVLHAINVKEQNFWTECLCIERV